MADELGSLIDQTAAASLRGAPWSRQAAMAAREGLRALLLFCELLRCQACDARDLLFEAEGRAPARENVTSWGRCLIIIGREGNG
jgi:hypothetical protein